MAKKHKCPECPAGEKWAVPYADFLSLLLALFIALWAISESNPAKTEALKTEFIKIFDFTPSQTVEQETQNQEQFKGASKTPEQELEDLKLVINSQLDTIDKLKAALDQSENQVALAPPARVEFERGSADITSADTMDFLNKMVKFSIESLRLYPQIQIEIRGYTDNSDNALRSFDLGMQRAEKVAQYFLDNGVDVKNLSLKTFGFNQPLENDASAVQNNRVEIYYKVESSNLEVQQSILENLKSLD